MYNSDALHYKIVWPIGIPYYHANWDDDDWLRFARSYRPSDYDGGEFDKQAWKEYTKAKVLKSFREFWPNFNIEPDGDGYKFTRKGTDTTISTKGA